MKVLDKQDDRVTVELTSDEILLINNALNEVIGGHHQLGEAEFHPITGVEKAEAVKLLDEIDSEYYAKKESPILGGDS